MKSRYVTAIFLIVSSLLAQAQLSESVDITPKAFSGDFAQIEYGVGNGFIALANNGYLYTSIDTGKTWLPKMSPIQDAHKFKMQLNGLTGYLLSADSVLKTEDGGKTWNKMIITGIPQTLDGYKMDYTNIFYKNQDTLFIIATNRVNGLKIYMSIDKGINWNLVAENLYSDNISNFISRLYFVSSLHGYAFGVGFYAETFNGGLTWTKHLFSQYETYCLENIRINDSTLIQSYSTPSETMPNLKGVIWYRAGIHTFAKTKNGILGIWYQARHTTIDTGKTWQITANTIDTYFNDMCFMNDSIGVMVGNNLTSYVTLDGGITWKKYVHGGAEGFNQIYCKNDQECFITGQTGRLFRTQDGGDTWTWKDLHNGSLHEIEFPTPDTGYVVGPYVLFRTIDGGDTWTKISHSLENGEIIEFPTKDIGFMGYSGGQYSMYRTNNSGDTWTRYAGMTYLTNKTLTNGFAFRSETEGLVCADDNKLLYTNNGCATWQLIESIPVGYYMYDVVSVSDRGWLLQANVMRNNEVSFDMFYCDNSFNCQKVVDGTDLYGGNLQQINDSTYYFTHHISYDYGQTWDTTDLMIGGQEFFVNPNLAFSIGTLNIKKATFYNKILTLTLQKQSNRQYQVTIASSLQADIYIKDALGNSTKIASQINLQNGVAYNLTIPQSVTQGTYTIIIEPITSGYASVESEPIVIDSTIGITDIAKQDCFSVKGKTVYALSQKPVKIYNIMGVQIPIQKQKVELQPGMYILQSECGVEKIIIK